MNLTQKRGQIIQPHKNNHFETIIPTRIFFYLTGTAVALFRPPMFAWANICRFMLGSKTLWCIYTTQTFGKTLQIANQK